MPSLTIHLLTARKYDPNASTAFYIGSIAPDSVRSREDKDRTHLRVLTESERPAALERIRSGLDLGDPVQLGAFLHMYGDYVWDTTLQKRYITNYGEGWFLPYREQISIAGAWIYHNDPAIRRVWSDMNAAVDNGFTVDVGALTCRSFRAECENICGVECGNVPQLIRYQLKQNIDGYRGASEAFTPDEVERYAEDTASGFRRLYL